MGTTDEGQSNMEQVKSITVTVETETDDGSTSRLVFRMTPAAFKMKELRRVMWVDEGDPFGPQIPKERPGSHRLELSGQVMSGHLEAVT